MMMSRKTTSKHQGPPNATKICQKRVLVLTLLYVFCEFGESLNISGIVLPLKANVGENYPWSPLET